MFDADLDDPGDYRAQVLAHLRKESLDLYNRVHSIAEDVGFVDTVVSAYQDLPVLPNLRCGAWYVDPGIARKEPAYFKSTDGHFNNWSFNLRRPNLHLLSIIVEHHGFILIDSTRAGKRMPDALSKTVPIWCAVVNRAIKIAQNKDDEWDTELYTPPGTVSPQEHAQINIRLDAWARSLVESSYVLPDIERPLRPMWITPATSTFPKLPVRAERTFSPIICLSASRQIQEGIERRSHGFSYVQGSGDDHELWGMGLTPDLFWKHKDELLSADRDDIEELVKKIVKEKPTHAHTNWLVPPTPIRAAGGRLLISSIDDLPAVFPPSLPNDEDEDADTAYILMSDRPQKNFSSSNDLQESEKLAEAPLHAGRVLFLNLAEGKRGQLEFLGSVLPQALPYIDEKLSQGARVCICCESGKDPSVGVALAALQMFFDEHGEFVPAGELRNTLNSSANKKSISTRLQWIITSRPQANPSRTTLKRVNEYLLTPPSLRRQYHALEESTRTQ